MLRTSAAPVCRHRVSDPVHQKFLPSAPGQHWEWMACQDLASAVLTLQKHQTQFNCLQICSAFFWCCRCFCSFAFTILYLIEIYGMDLPYNNHCPGLLRKGFSHTPVPPDQWTCVDPALRAFSFSDRENIISRKHHMIYGFKWECLRDIPPYQEKKLIMCWAGLQNWRLLISVPSQSQLPAAASLVPSSQRRSSENALPGRSPNKTLNAAVPPNIFSQFRHAGMQQSMDDFWRFARFHAVWFHGLLDSRPPVEEVRAVSRAQHESRLQKSPSQGARQTARKPWFPGSKRNMARNCPKDCRTSVRSIRSLLSDAILPQLDGPAVPCQTKAAIILAVKDGTRNNGSPIHLSVFKSWNIMHYK